MNLLLNSSSPMPERFLNKKTVGKSFFQQFTIYSISLALFFLSALSSKAQESISGLTVNPALINQNQHASRLKAGSDTIVLKLPFIEDFSSAGVYPDQKKWIDKYVFINSTYPVNPVSIGVATFDALDENGYLYSASDTVTFFKADQLTSRQIDLNFPNRSDIYLSFLFEPGGIGSNEIRTGSNGLQNIFGGNLPEANDSLILEFYSPTNQVWKQVWGISGDTVAHKFRQIMVHITESEYLQKGFRFRFHNLVSLGIDPNASDGMNKSNQDLWHLDYVRLDTGRNENDTIIKDVAFVEPMHSLLKNYQSMPWDHFKVAFKIVIKPKIDVIYRNNDKIVHNVIRNFEVNDLYGTDRAVFSAGKEDIQPGKNFFLETNLSDPFTTASTDSALFEARSYLITDDGDLKSNDTIRFRQVFNNYFAYDDGTPEYSYGFKNNEGDFGRLAYQFTSYLSDTLVAVKFFFTSSKWTQSQNHFFKLAIWADNNGQPGKLLYLKSDESYSTDSIKPNAFNTFKLDTSLIVKGKYYVGFIQSDYFYMNIGYDKNNNSDAYTYFLYLGFWKKSQSHGSLMIRPVFRHQKNIVLGNQEIRTKSFTVYPNPANGMITVDFGDIQGFGNASYSLYNSLGMKVMESTFSGNNIIDVSNLASGFYILKLARENIRFAPVKLLIQR